MRPREVELRALGLLEAHMSFIYLDDALDLRSDPGGQQWSFTADCPKYYAKSSRYLYGHYGAAGR
jgi:hypothetical protein